MRLLRSCVADLCVNVCAYARRACGDSSSSALSAVLWNAASLGSFESTLGFQNPKAFDLFFSSLSPYPEENPFALALSLSLSAGMNAHVEMLARLHTQTKFSHTKARESRRGRRGRGGRGRKGEREGGGGGSAVWGGVGDERASRRKIKGSRGSAPLTPPPRFIKICLPIPTLILTQSLSAQTDAETQPLPLPVLFTFFFLKTTKQQLYFLIKYIGIKVLFFFSYKYLSACLRLDIHGFFQW